MTKSKQLLESIYAAAVLQPNNQLHSTHSKSSLSIPWQFDECSGISQSKWKHMSKIVYTTMYTSTTRLYVLKLGSYQKIIEREIRDVLDFNFKK